MEFRKNGHQKKTFFIHNATEVIWYVIWVLALVFIATIYILVAISMGIIPVAVILAGLIVGIIYFTALKKN